MEEFNLLVKSLIDKALEIRTDLFLVDLKIDQKLHVTIIIDGDRGVNLSDCIEISRAVEHNIDPEVFDFSLDVSSPGAFSDIKFSRQYNKNIGRYLAVQTIANENFEGELMRVENDTIKLQWETREPKKIGKGKENVLHEKTLSLSEIKKANVVFK